MLHRIVVLGDGGVGKSAFIMQYCRNQFVTDYDPTIEDSYRKQVIVDKKSCILEILDTAGQEEFVSLRDQWIRDGDAFVLMYSVDNYQSFELLKEIRRQIGFVKGTTNVPIVFVGNKADLKTVEVTYEQGYRYARDISVPLTCRFFETSAKTGKNVENVFTTIVRAIRSIEAPKERKTCIIF
jgi:GTPase KRas protein